MLAVGLAVAACQAGFTVYFTTLDDLVRRLRAAEATSRFSRQLQAYLRPSLLIVDLCRHGDYAEAGAVVGSRRGGRGFGLSA
jgi:hypothetical protein